MDRLIGCIAFSIVLLATPALAAFEQMAIQEVFFGPPSDYEIGPPLSPDQRMQHVTLRMTSAGQTTVAGTSLRVEDGNGNLLGSFGAFTAAVGNGGGACSYPSCPAIVIGTAAADGLYSFSFDKNVDGQAARVALSPMGGRICFISGSSVVDCVAWGNFNCTRSGNCSLPNGGRTADVSANGCDLNFGTPVTVPHPGAIGRVLRRTTFSCGSKENSNDFVLGFPQPVNNAGANDNTDTDGDGLIDVVDCDDTPGSGTAYLWPIGANLANVRLVLSKVPTLSLHLSYSQEDTSGTAVTYDVAEFGKGGSDWVCLVVEEPTGSLTDLAIDPAPCLYLVRAKTSPTCGGTGIYGGPPDFLGTCP